MTSYFTSAIDSLTAPARNAVQVQKDAVIKQAKDAVAEQSATWLTKVGVSPAFLRDVADRMSAQGEQFIGAIVHDALCIIDNYREDLEAESEELFKSALCSQPWDLDESEFVQL